MRKKVIIAFAVSFTFSILYSLFIYWGRAESPSTLNVILNLTVIFLNFLIIGSFGYVVFKSNSQKTPEQTRKRIFPLFLFFVIGALLISLFIISLGNYLFYLAGGFETDNFLKHLVQVELPGTLKLFSIWILIASAFLFFSFWWQTINREQQLQEENLKYQYRTLKAQVNPHFLFNSLNTLSEIVYEDAKRADNYIQKLSGIYRYILDNEEVDLIPLDKEIGFVTTYFALQKERDGNKIELRIQISDPAKFRIVPVSLQILIENALKHNSALENNPLVISMSRENLFIVVSNNIQRKNTLENSYGTGLMNLKERVKLVTGKTLFISQENNEFIVKTPIVSIENESINHRR